MVTKKATSKKPVAKKIVGQSPPISRTPVVEDVASVDVEALDDVYVLPKVDKHKLVRDSFTIPEPEYVWLGLLKERLQLLARPTKKSELLRAGIAILASMSDADLLEAVVRVPSLKTGRPKSKAPKKKG